MTTPWFDEQNRLTPDDLQNVTFPVSRLGRRGYEEGPVNRLMRVVHAEFVRLVNERNSLWQDVQRLRKRILAGEAGGDPKAVLFGEADAHVHAVQILSTAQMTADRYVADAQAYSSRVTEEARRRRQDILREAQEHSEIILQDAHAQAREAAVSALNGAVAPQTDRERLAAQAELAYLRTYSGVYRDHLRAYTEGVLRGIEEWERKEADSIKEAASLHELTQGNGHGIGNGNGNGDRRSIGP